MNIELDFIKDTLNNLEKLKEEQVISFNKQVIDDSIVIISALKITLEDRE